MTNDDTKKKIQEKKMSKLLIIWNTLFLRQISKLEKSRYVQIQTLSSKVTNCPNQKNMAFQTICLKKTNSVDMASF